VGVGGRHHAPWYNIDIQILNFHYKHQIYSVHKRQSNPCTGLLQTQGFPGGWVSQISRQSTHEGGKVVSPLHRPPLLPKKHSQYSFVLERVMLKKTSNDTIGNQTCELPGRNPVPQRTTWECSNHILNTNFFKKNYKFYFYIYKTDINNGTYYRLQNRGNWFWTRHTVLPKNGTLIPKYVGDTSLIFIYIWYCGFGWCNKLSTMMKWKVKKATDSLFRQTVVPK
jgi:hypothetical protein